MGSKHLFQSLTFELWVPLNLCSKQAALSCPLVNILYGSAFQLGRFLGTVQALCFYCKL